jgi:hypothetical protein
MEVLDFILRRHTCRVFYQRTEQRCTFSAVSKVIRSVMVAEEIIELICRREGVSPFALYFYDLQTSHGFPYIPPGEYLHEQLQLRQTPDGITVDSWDPEECAQDTRRAFEPYVGPLTFDQSRQRPWERRTVLSNGKIGL